MNTHTFCSAAAGKQTEFSLSGSVTVDSVTVDAGVFFYKDSATSTQFWAIYGELRGNVTASDIVSALDGSTFDFAIDDVALIYASGDISRFGTSFNPLGYPVSPGMKSSSSAVDSLLLTYLLT